MKKAIFSLNVGNNEMYKPALDSISKYAKKIEADFFVGDSIKINAYNFYFEKLQCLSLFQNEKYDQVLYMDADVLVTPKASNIFDDYPDPTCFYAHNENADSEAMDRDRFVNPLVTNEFEWSKINGKYQYFNAGIMLFGKDSWRQVINGIESPPKNSAIWEFGDQTFMNYLVAKNKVKFISLDRKYNWMNCGESDPQKKRFKANFIHYAGPCLYGGTKKETIERDYRELYLS